MVANSTGTGTGLFVNSAAGQPAVIGNANAANANTVLEVNTAGTGDGIDVNLTNGGSSADGISVSEVGTGNGIAVTGDRSWRCDRYQ